MSNKVEIAGIRAKAIAEIIAMLVVLALFGLFLGDKDMFWNVNPHPFWIPVVWVAAQYGAWEGALAGILATIVFLLFGTWPAHAEGVDTFTYSYDIVINPLLWIVGGAAIGAVAERHLRKVKELSEEVEQSHTREETITESYKFVKGRKEDLETQVAGKLTSSVQAYRAAKAVERLNPGDVLKGVEDLVSAILQPRKFSVYTLNDNRLKGTILHGWNQADQYSQEIDNSSALYQAVIGQQRVLVAANEEDENTLNRQGVLAGPIIDPESKHIVGMLKIEQMDFANLSLNTIETFKALCEWIGTSMLNAENYQTVKEGSVINPEHNLMTYSFFKRQSDYLGHLAKRVGFDLSMIVVRLTNSSQLSESDNLVIARQLSESVRKVLRNVDLAFEYQTDGAEYSVLLPATSQQGANVVRDKIASDLDKNLRNFGDSNFSYIVQAIHEAA